MTYYDDLKSVCPSAADHIDLVPRHMHDAVALWIVHGIEPGSFLTAVICNDLQGAVGQADDINRNCLVKWVRFFYNYVPHQCWGSEDRARAWAEVGGGRGLSQQEGAA